MLSRKTTWLIYDFIIFKEVVLTYVNKLCVIDLILCLKLQPLKQTVWLTQEYDTDL